MVVRLASGLVARGRGSFTRTARQAGVHEGIEDLVDGLAAHPPLLVLQQVVKLDDGLMTARLAQQAQQRDPLSCGSQPLLRELVHQNLVGMPSHRVTDFPSELSIPLGGPHAMAHGKDFA